MPRPRDGRPRPHAAFLLLALLALSAPTLRAQASLPLALDAMQLQVACGPRVTYAESPSPLRILASQEGVRKRMLGPGDGVVIAGGSAQGVQVGQEYYVRRLAPVFSSDGRAAASIPVETAGWLRITAVQPETSIAEVVHACDGLLLGDYLEPFALPQLPPAPVGAPVADYNQTGVILWGMNAKRTMASGELILMSRGAAEGVVMGQRATVFRAPFGPAGPVIEIARGFAVEVAPHATMIRIEEARAAIYSGDAAALHPLQP